MSADLAGLDSELQATFAEFVREKPARGGGDAGYRRPAGLGCDLPGTCRRGIAEAAQREGRSGVVAVGQPLALADVPTAAGA